MNNSTQDNTVKPTLTKLSTTANRAPSVRALTLSNKPTTTPETNTKKSNSASKTTSSINSPRLPGLHGNLVQGIGSKLSAKNTPQPSGIDVSDLAQRIVDLEEEIQTKQEILESGNGIDIDGKTISLSQEIVSLPERLEEINQNIDNLNKQFDPKDYYTVGDIEQNYYTKEDIDQIVEERIDQITPQLPDLEIVNTFDSTFLVNKGKKQEQKD